MLSCGLLLYVLFAAISAVSPTSTNKGSDEAAHSTSYLTSSDLQDIYMRLSNIPILHEDDLFPDLYARVLQDVINVQESILDNLHEGCLQDAVDISYLLPNVHLQGDRNSIQNYEPLPKPSQPYYSGPQARRLGKDVAMPLPWHFIEQLVQIGKTALDLRTWILDPFYAKQDQYYELRVTVSEDAWFGIAYRAGDRIVLPFGFLKLSSNLLNIDSEKNKPRDTDRSAVRDILRARSCLQSKERVFSEYGFIFHNPFIDDVWFPILLTKKNLLMNADSSISNGDVLETPCALAVRPVLPKAYFPSKAWSFDDAFTSHPILVDTSYHPAPPIVADTFWEREKVFRSGRRKDKIWRDASISSTDFQYLNAYQEHWNDWVVQKLLQARFEKKLPPLDYDRLSEAAFQVPLVKNPSFDREDYLLQQKRSIEDFNIRRILVSTHV